MCLQGWKHQFSSVSEPNFLMHMQQQDLSSSRHGLPEKVAAGGSRFPKSVSAMVSRPSTRKNVKISKTGHQRTAGHPSKVYSVPRE